MSLDINDLKKLLKPADVLLIVPPFVNKNYQSVGVHTLQACCKEAGFSVQIFYASIHFAAQISKEYESLVNMSNYLIGERIFSRAAFGEIGYERIHEKIYDSTYNFGLQLASQIENNIYSYPQINQLNINRLKQIEQKAYNWVKEVSKILSTMPYKIIGCTSTFEQVCSSIALLKEIKKAKPDITTIIGGSNCEGIYAEGIASLDPERNIIDYIFSGESEKSLIDFLSTFANGKKKYNHIIHGKPYADLDDLPPVDYRQYFEQLYSFQPSYLFNPEKIMISYETSRGCWWGEKSQCLFCGLNGEKMAFRLKSSNIVLKDLDGFKKYQINHIQMTDTIMPRTYFDTLLQDMGKINHGFNIFYEQKANLPYYKLKLLKNAGINYIQPGVETFSNRLLRVMKKGVTAWQNIGFLRDSLILQIKLKWNFIWGFPNEQTQDYKEMIEFIPLLIHLPPPFGVFHLALARFSPYYNNPEKYGIKNIKAPISYREVLPSYANVEKIAVFFTADYEAETYKDPTIISQFIDIIHHWNERWQSEETRPVLHLEKQSDDEYLLKDTRNLPGTGSSYLLNRDQASAVLACGKYTESEDQKWALDKKAAIVMENRFVSLITTSPDVMENLNKNVAFQTEFTEKINQGKKWPRIHTD